MVVDQCKLVGRWSGDHGGNPSGSSQLQVGSGLMDWFAVLWELEAAGYTANSRIYLAQNYQRFTESSGQDRFKPLVS